LKSIAEDSRVALAKPSNHETDDAAFVHLDDEKVLISSVDFQNPVLPDAYTSGKIAALNALSDIFACGTKPNWAEAILAVPALDADEQIKIGQEIMRGMAEVCQSVGCHIVGGHTIVMQAPLIGLAVRGIADADQVKRKSGAQVGDAILITKPVGNGIAVAARQSGFLQDAAWNTAQTAMLAPNAIGSVLGAQLSVTSLTDVTGFGLLGHAVEVGEASNACVELHVNAVPVFPSIKRAAAAGHIPLLALSNWESFEGRTSVPLGITKVDQMVLADPQTNGGLMFTVAPGDVEAITATCLSEGVKATVVGRITEHEKAFCRLVKE